MAVTTLSRTRARRTSAAATTLPPLVLVVALVPAALDLLGNVHSAISVDTAAMISAAFAALALGVAWARYPRTSWLAAAVLAAAASVAIRVIGADVAPAFSLLAILAVGIGGGFASPGHDLQGWLEIQPSVARR
ncbi:MAG TPA: hypothetical protein VFG86_04200 [Chloroflexota bacterium]|jgi:hypothetical protein|nr:hypothetical protein [Chloroflexota bacterium]